MLSAPPAVIQRLRSLHHSLRFGVDADLSHIRMLVVAGLPVDGLAFGNCIALSSSLLERDPRELLHAAVHEITHVFQQRAGRVRATGQVGRMPFSTDLTLEAEAEKNARRVVNGDRIRLRASQGSPSIAVPVLQPLLTLNGQALADTSALSDRFKRLLALVPQGPAWLEWALRSPSPALSFSDESSLLHTILLGLHATADVCFQSAGVRLSPTLLLPLGDPDFGNVVNSLETGQLTPAARQVLASRQIRTEADFSALRALLEDLGLSAALPLATPTLAELVALDAQFTTDSVVDSDPALPAAAAQFAAAHAQTATDFAAAFSFYRAVAADGQKPAEVWTALYPLAFPYLQSPTCDPLIADADLAQFVVDYLRRNGFIGFLSSAIALSAFATDAGLNLATPLGTDVAGRINSYMVGLSKLVAPLPDGTFAEPSITLLQDGLTRWIDYSGTTGSARLQLDPTGLLTLRRYSPSPTA